MFWWLLCSHISPYNTIIHKLHGIFSIRLPNIIILTFFWVLAKNPRGLWSVEFRGRTLRTLCRSISESHRRNWFWRRSGRLSRSKADFRTTRERPDWAEHLEIPFWRSGEEQPTNTFFFPSHTIKLSTAQITLLKLIILNNISKHIMKNFLPGSGRTHSNNIISGNDLFLLLFYDFALYTFE